MGWFRCQKLDLVSQRSSRRARSAIDIGRGCAPACACPRTSRPGSLTVREVCGLATGSCLRPSLPFQNDQEQSQLPAGRQPPFSQLHQRLPGQPERQLYIPEGPPLLLDAEGQVRWIANYIVVYEDPHREARARFHLRASIVYDGSGFHQMQDTWEPRSSLLREIPDGFRAYKLMDSTYPDMSANMTALVLNESDKAVQEVENGNGVKVENVVVTGHQHDRMNGILLGGA